MRCSIILIILKSISYLSLGQPQEPNYSLISSELDSIYDEDQVIRKKIIENHKKYGWDSREVKSLVKQATFIDSLNLVRVKSIIKRHGWLGPKKIGDKANKAIFLVIQHADNDLAMQTKSLSTMKRAVRKGDANAKDLALLQDRVARGHGKRQVYGSQIEKTKAGEYFIAPIKNEKNVNKRRAKAGLQPLEQYAEENGIKYISPK